MIEKNVRQVTASINWLAYGVGGKGSDFSHETVAAWHRSSFQGSPEGESDARKQCDGAALWRDERGDCAIFGKHRHVSAAPPIGTV
jgi:hypothetical protein